MIKSSIFTRSNCFKSELWKAYILIFFDIFIPFATEIDVLIHEKLPGPVLTSIENLLYKITLYFFNRFNMFETNLSFLFIIWSNS